MIFKKGVAKLHDLDAIPKKYSCIIYQLPIFNQFEPILKTLKRSSDKN